MAAKSPNQLDSVALTVHDVDSKRCSTCNANNSVATKRKIVKKTATTSILTMHLQQTHTVRFACISHRLAGWLARSSFDSAIKVRHRVSIIVCSFIRCLSLCHWRSSHNIVEKYTQYRGNYKMIGAPLYPYHANQFTHSTSICCVLSFYLDEFSCFSCCAYTHQPTSQATPTQ